MGRPYAQIIETLKCAGLRPTRQRVGLCSLLFRGEGDRHVTADQLCHEAAAAGIKVSLATVYNTLNQLKDAGLLSEVVVDAGRSYFDTNLGGHHHFYNVDTGELADIPGSNVEVSRLPRAPKGTAIRQVDIVVRIQNNRAESAV